MPARTVEIAFMGSTAQLEASLERAGLVARESGNTIGDSFTKGTTKAGGAISKLSQVGASFGIPFASSLGTVGKHLDETTTKTARLHTTLAAAGKLTLFAGGAGLAVASAEAIKLGAAFESAGAKIRESTGESAENIKRLTHAFGDTAGKFEDSGQQMEAAYAGVAGQLKVTEGHALSTGEALKFQAAATELSTGAGEDLIPTTGALASVMQTFHLSVDKASGSSDELFNISHALNTPITVVASAVDKLHGRLGALAPSLADTGALMLDIGEHGITGGKGVMVANSAMQTLAGGSAKTEAVLKALGMSVYDQNGKFIGLQNVIAQLQPKLAGLSQEQQHYALQALFGKGATEVMGRVVREGASGFERAAGAATKLGTAHAAAKVQAETLGGEMHTVEATVETLGGKFGMVLAPDVKLAGKALADGVGWMEKHKTAAQVLGGVITGVLGLAVAVYAEQKAVKFAKATANMIGDMGKLVSKIKIGTGEIVGSFAAQDEAAATSAGSIGASTKASSSAVQYEAAKMQASSAEVDASFAGQAGAAASAEAGVSAAVAGEASAVAAADSTIEADNAAAGASFGGLLSKLGALGAALPALAVAGASAGEALAGNTSEPFEKRAAARAKKLAQEKGLTGADVNAATSGGGSVEKQILNFFLKQGFSKNAAAGIVGNIAQESSFNPNAPGGGLFQDIGGRGAPQGSSVKAQLEAADRELRGPYHDVFERIQHAKSPQEAAEIFAGHAEHGIRGFENPKESAANYAHRERAAQEAAAHSNAALQKLMDETASGSGGSSAKKKKTVAALGVPAGVTTMLATAQALLGTKYTSGGGHDGWDPIATLKKIGVDCSGFVSQVLHRGGVPLSNPVTTQGLPGAKGISKGAGRFVTLYDRPDGSQAHVIADILGKYFESGGNSKYNPKGGVSLLTAAQAKGELAGGGFQAFHPTDLNAPVRGGANQSTLLKGLAPEEASAAAFAEAIKKRVAELKSHGESELSKLRDAPSRTLAGLQGLLGATTTSGAPASNAQRQFVGLVEALRATHEKGLMQLATKLVTVHKSAEDTLRQKNIDAQTEALAAQERMSAEALSNETAQAKDQTQIITDMADQVVQAMKDASQGIADSLAAQATAIKDQTREMADASSAVVQQIQDQSQLATDKLAERGLYGLNLVAQQQQVQLDEMKMSYDAQNAKAQQAIDTAQTATDKASAATQALVDAVTGQQNVLISQAQQNLDSVTKSNDLAVQEAQTAVARASTGSQAQQDEAAAKLLHAEAASAAAIQQAQAGLSGAQSAAARAEQEASNALAAAHGNAEVVLAQAEQTLTAAQDRANQSEAEQQALIAKTQAEANTQYAGSGLTVNIEGINPTDAAAVASEVGWKLRTVVPA